LFNLVPHTGQNFETGYMIGSRQLGHFDINSFPHTEQNFSLFE